MNNQVKDLKTKFLRKKINAIESINQVANEIGNLAKDNTVGNAVNTLNKIETLFKQFNLIGTNELIKNLNNIDELKLQVEELIKINKALNLIAKKNPEIKINDLIKWPSKPSDAIPVVLTDKFKEDFYDAIKSLPVFFGGGGNATEINQINSKQITQIKENLPTNQLSNNPSDVIIRNSDNYIIQIDRTIGTTTIRKIYTRDTNNWITHVSNWIEV